jgi:hypothetical protein
VGYETNVVAERNPEALSGMLLPIWRGQAYEKPNLLVFGRNVFGSYPSGRISNGSRS